jgi:hypothetical protein
MSFGVQVLDLRPCFLLELLAVQEVYCAHDLPGFDHQELLTAKTFCPSLFV